MTPNKHRSIIYSRKGGESIGKITRIFPGRVVPIEEALCRANAEREIDNPQCVPTRLNLYAQTIAKATVFLTDGRGKLTYDDPNQPLSYHSVIIDLFVDEFEGDEIRQFTEILNAFDSMEMVVVDDYIMIILIFDGIYVPK